MHSRWRFGRVGHGKTLDGWKVNGGTVSYEVEDGVVLGTTVEGSPNTFLCRGDYKDFDGHAVPVHGL